MTARSVLVVGYGNELRGDDAVGPRVARIVAGWARPGLQALAVHQLNAELAEALQAVQLAVFIDASVEPAEDVGVRLLAPAGNLTCWNHGSDPGWLLGLARCVFGRQPTAWLVTIPAEDFGFGAPLSARAERGMEEALRQVARLVEEC